MPAAPLAPNESQRLAAAHKTRHFGTPAEERFDKITRLARQMFGVKMALIDLVGEDINWFKSACGIDGTDEVRTNSYCQWTVTQEGITHVTDATTDPRVHDRPASGIWRFYAGAPLHFDGHRVGALCIADTSPRALDDDQLSALSDLAELAERELQVAALSEAQAALAASNKELEMKAKVDILTHVWNRGAIMDIAQGERERAAVPPSTAILMIDIDHFKKINDTYGHPAGDEVLRVIAARLRSNVRPQDAVGRYGGEEFLAVLAGATSETGEEIANRICHAIAESPIQIGDITIPVTGSIGCAASGNDQDTVSTLIQHADSALYQAKHGGRNRVVRHTAA